MRACTARTFAMGFRQRQQISEVVPRNPSEGKVLAVGGGSQSLHDSRDPINIG